VDQNKIFRDAQGDVIGFCRCIDDACQCRILPTPGKDGIPDQFVIFQIRDCAQARGRGLDGDRLSGPVNLRPQHQLSIGRYTRQQKPRPVGLRGGGFRFWGWLSYHRQEKLDR